MNLGSVSGAGGVGDPGGAVTVTAVSEASSPFVIDIGLDASITTACEQAIGKLKRFAMR